MKDLTKGKPSTLILAFALPIFLANLLQLTYSLVDTRIVGAFLGEDTLAGFFTSIPVLGEFLAALVGLIPNCASSVVITELYLSGVIGAGAMMSGLLVNAGVGILVLLRIDHDRKETAKIVAALYALGVFWGLVIEMLGVVF